MNETNPAGLTAIGESNAEEPGSKPVSRQDERRTHPRLWCADFVEVEYRDKSGRRRLQTVNLEDISQTGACIQMDNPLPIHAPIRLRHGKGELPGKIRYCVFRQIGYFIGVEFDPGFRWTQRSFRPMHLTDPRRLVTRSLQRVDARRPA